MIRITNGTYGHRDNGRTVPLTPESGPVELDKATEDRLVSLGVAVFVDAEAPAGKAPITDPESPYIGKSAKQLRATLAERGIKAPSKAKVAELIAMLEKDDDATSMDADDGEILEDEDDEMVSTEDVDGETEVVEESDDESTDAVEPPNITPESIVS